MARSRLLTTGFTIAALCLIPAWALAQTIYRSTSADGRTTFSDIPTPQGSRAEPRAAINPSSEAEPTLPNALRAAVSRFPVTLYAARDCSPCDNARQMLRGRGIPFTEKSIDTAEDLAAFKQLSGANTLPMLSIGSQQFKGYSESGWQQYLSVAGYPQASLLPPGYRHSTATPLVSARPANAPAPPETPSSSATPMTPAPTGPAPANPAGITF